MFGGGVGMCFVWGFLVFLFGFGVLRFFGFFVCEVFLGFLFFVLIII